MVLNMASSVLSLSKLVIDDWFVDDKSSCIHRNIEDRVDEVRKESLAIPFSKDEGVDAEGSTPSGDHRYPGEIFDMDDLSMPKSPVIRSSVPKRPVHFDALPPSPETTVRKSWVCSMRTGPDLPEKPVRKNSILGLMQEINASSPLH